jgi:chondroitin 4-sulfotransferase 11
MYDLNKKIIFTHPPKCGGTSIEEMLGFLKLREKYPQVHKFKHGSLKMHVDKIKTFGLDPGEFFKFSVIRNPWDRAVSFYNHTRHKEYEYFLKRADQFKMPKYVKDSKQMTFKEFAFKYFKKNFNSELTTNPYMVLEDTFSLDCVIKLENLKEEFSLIKDKLQFTSEIDVPHLNNSEKYIVRKDYKDFYDEETKNLIYNLFEWDIKTFKYTY